MNEPDVREKLGDKLARIWYSRTLFSPLVRWIATWGVAFAAMIVGFFVATAVAAGDAGWAFSVLVGAAPPFRRGDSWAAVPLAAFGFLLLPALIGAAVGLALQQKLDSMALDEDAVLEAVLTRVGALQGAAPAPMAVEEADDSPAP